MSHISVEVVIPKCPKLHQLGALLTENQGEGPSGADPTLLHQKESTGNDLTTELLQYKWNIRIHSATVEHLKDVMGEVDAQWMLASWLIKGLLLQVYEAQEALVWAQEELVDFEDKMDTSK
jgi:hypothetical protein